MREIKFRAWDEINKVIEYDVNVNQGKAVKQGYQWFNTENTVHHSDLMQYTGLTDKTGKEIYEGDIYLNPLGNKMKIIFSLKEASFVGKSLSTGDELPLLNLRGRLNGEIIGNIYEDKRLLEVQT